MSEIDAERAALIEGNLALVQHVVLQVAGHFPRHVDRGELARAGALGLVEAARRYDAERGVPFDRFAARRIKGAILDAVRAADWAPRSVRALGRRLEEVEQRLATRHGSVPPPDVIAAELGVSADELSRLRDRVFRSVVLALEHVVPGGGDDEDLTLGDILADRTAIEPSEALEARELLGYLRDAVHLLPERHQTVVVGYFLEGRTSTELAAELGVTESRISQLRSEALVFLREGIEAQYAPAARKPGEVDSLVPMGRAAKRKAGFITAIGEASAWRERIVC